MLVIRKQQIDVFNQVVLKSFESEMVMHCRDFSPRLFKVIGEDQMRRVVQLGMADAGGYGFTYRGPVRFYIEMMLLFGSHFDTDPQYLWATEILQNQALGSQMERAELLYEHTLDFLDNVVGPDDRFTLRALQRIASLAKQPPVLSQENLMKDLRLETYRIYPEKAEYIGDQGLGLLIGEGIDKAAGYGMAAPHSQALFCVLMFAFGHGCADDPLYPWISRTLKDERIVDPTARADRLERKAVTWLNHVVAWLEEGIPS